MKPAQHPTALRTQQRLADAGLDSRVVEFEQPTRTSAEAAAAIGCEVAEIAKSIVFRGKTSGQAVLVVDMLRSEQERVTAIVTECMESAAQLKVRLIADAGVGGNWLEAH